MEFVSLYLGQHQNKNVLYFYNKNCSFNSLLKCLEISIYESFIIVVDGKDIKHDLESRIRDHPEAKIVLSDSGLTSYYDYTVVITSENDCGRLQNLKVSEILGEFPEKTDSFAIWEEAKKIAEKVRICRKKNEYENEVLKWDRNGCSDIELSVILPVYNVEKYLDKCISTLCAWDAPYVEFLFVNDGSKDNSRNIILEYAKKDPRIKLLDKENGGCASAREYGFEHAKGRYLGLIDPDDFIDPSMFKKLLARAMMGGYDIAFCGYNEYYEDTKTYKKVIEPFNECFLDGSTDQKLIDQLIAYQRIAIWRSIFKKQFIANNDLHFHTDIKRHDDLPFKIETYAKAKSVVGINEYLYFYRLGREGQDVSATDKRLYVHFDIFKHLDAFFEKNYNRHQVDYYYIAKVQTYHWVATKIDNDLINDFLKLAAKDLGIENNKKSWKTALKKSFKHKEVKTFFKILKEKKAKFEV